MIMANTLPSDFPPATAKRAGAVVLARHGKPALSRRCWLSATEYVDWWARYEEGGLYSPQSPPADLLATAQKAAVLLTSSRRRARETGDAVCGGRVYKSEDLFIEAPLPPPPLPSWFKMPPRLWGVLSRLCWHLCRNPRGGETRKEAEQRAGRAADYLIARAEHGHDVLLLAHGYFNFMIGKQLQARGWKLTLDQGFKYWRQRRFERV